MRLRKETLAELADGELGLIAGAERPPSAPVTYCVMCLLTQHITCLCS